MTITRVGAASQDGNTVTTLTLTHGLTINEDDVIIFFLNADGAASNRSGQPTVDADLYSANTLSGHVLISRKVAGASEPSSYAWTFTSGERCVGAIMVYRGVDTTTPIDSNNGPNAGGPSLTGTFTSLTPTQDGCAVITHIACQEGNSSAASFSAWPSTITERFDDSSPGAGSGAKSAGGGDVIQTTATAVSGTVTISHADNTNWECFVIALAPAGAGGTINSKTLTDTLVVTDPKDMLRLRERVQTDGLAIDYSLETIRKRRVSILNNVVALTDNVIAVQSEAPTVIARTLTDTLAVTDPKDMLRLRDRALLDSAISEDVSVELRKRNRIQTDELAIDYSLETIRKRIVTILNNVVSVTDAIIAEKTQAPAVVVKTDSIVATDFDIELRLRFRELLDTIAVIDNLERSVLSPRTLSDSLAVADFTDWFKEARRDNLDTIAANDFVDWFKEARRDSLDTITASDFIDWFKEARRDNLDTITASDFTDWFKEARRSNLDTIAVTEVTVTLRERIRVLTDIIAVIDSLIALRLRFRLVQDAIAVTDVLERSAISARILSDAIAIPDDAIILRKRIRVLQDSIAITDFALIPEIGTVLQDAIALTDSSVKLRLRFREAVDEITALDSIVQKPIRPRFPFDAFTATDSHIELRQRFRVLIDSIAIIDSIVAQKIGEGIKLTDSIVVTDDAIELRERNREALDAIAVTDSHIELRERVRVLLDSITVTDFALIPEIGTVLQDVIDVIDVSIELRIRLRETLDSIAVTDAIDKITIRPHQLLDSAAVTDNQIELRQRFRVLLDAIAVVDSTIVQKTSGGLKLLDAIAVTDSHIELRERNRVELSALAAVDFDVELRERFRVLLDTIEVVDIALIPEIGTILQDVIIATDTFALFRERYQIVTDSAVLTDSAIATYIAEGIVINTVSLMDQMDVSDFINAMLIEGLTKFAIRHNIDQLNIDHSVENFHILNKISQES